MTQLSLTRGTKWIFLTHKGKRNPRQLRTKAWAITAYAGISRRAREMLLSGSLPGATSTVEFSLYLFKSDVQAITDAIDPKKFGRGKDYAPLSLKPGLPFVARAYLKRGEPAQPRWLPFVRQGCTVRRPAQLESARHSAIIFLECSGRVFAVPFGSGHTALDRSKLEKSFGLRTLLNIVDPQSIRTLDARELGGPKQQKRLNMSKGSKLYHYEFDAAQDVLSGVSGKPTDPNFASKVTGTDCLRIAADIEFAHLGDKCTAALEAFEKDDYKVNFAFIDDVQMVQDDQLIAELDDVLEDALKNLQLGEMSLLFPEIGFAALPCEYHFKCKDAVSNPRTTLEVDDLQAFFAQLPQGWSLADCYVTAELDDGTPYPRHLKESLLFDVTHNGVAYTLSDDRWYEVAPTYRDELTQAIGHLEQKSVNLHLPDFDGSVDKKPNGHLSEGLYNERATNLAPGNRWMFDRVNFPDGSGGTIELCDIFTSNREFIHVKRWHCSQTFSALCGQGYVSAAHFVRDVGYRTKLQDGLPPPYKPLVDPAACDPTMYTVIYALAHSHPAPLANCLPFFSKVNLMRHVKDIRRLGFQTALKKIPAVNIP